MVVKRVDIHVEDPEPDVQTESMPLDPGPDFDEVPGKPNYYRRKSDGHLVYAARRQPAPPSGWEIEE